MRAIDKLVRTNIITPNIYIKEIPYTGNGYIKTMKYKHNYIFQTI